MATKIVMRTGHEYFIDPGLTPAQVNAALDENAHRFIEVPLDPSGPASAAPGTPGGGQVVLHLYITPDSVSHFVVV